jgi:hypothetical protein
VIASREKPGRLTVRRYSDGTVSTTIQLSGGGGAWLRNGCEGGGGGVRIVGGVGVGEVGRAKEVGGVRGIGW